ncbi:hypothetical protein J7E29_16395 [Streptomyces sp. ISL-90]|nr:hypothetical protein [Streptomyces sp. ISL-90]
MATVVSFLVVVAYVFVTLLFVSPPNPVKTAFAGVTRVASPYFAQKWNVFAPNIAKSNPQLRIQAQWRDDEGRLVKSEWRNVTAVEFAAVPGNALPSRIQKLSWNALGSYLTRFRELTTDQRAMVQDTFIERIDDGYRGIPPQQLIDRLVAFGENRGDVIDILRYDFMLKEYTTYFATAVFDKKIERIRWEVYRERPNDFDLRFQDAAQYEPTITRFGWRQADDRIRADALATFDDVVARYGDGS